MSRVAAILFSLFCLSYISCAKEPPIKQEKCLVADDTNIDFGTIRLDRKSRIELFLRSTGTQPVTITKFDISGEDPDLEITVPHPPIVLKPEETIVMAITFDPHSAGKATAVVTVTTDSTTTPTVILNLKANSYDQTMLMTKLNKLNDLKTIALFELGYYN